MSAGYTWVGWSPHKRLYDAIVVAAVVTFIAAFMLVGTLGHTGSSAISPEILLIRATGSCAIVLLHVILLIGPLARLDRRLLPVLYNRRHLGVVTFLIGLVHGSVSLGFYHGFGIVNPLTSLLTSNTNYTSLESFPYQPLGLFALVILFLLAATSHDFWLKNLSAQTWKRLHMSVYLAYALLVAHVALGALQNDRGLWMPVLMGGGVVCVVTLHVWAAAREALRDAGSRADDDGWIDVGVPEDIPDNRARVVCPQGGERIAVFKHDGRISAVTNVCAHQGGPLGEGTVIDGCITCPWHGWQYRPGDGRAPPPFVEKITTYNVRICGGRVQVNTRALEPGTPTQGAAVPAEEADDAA